MRGYKGRNGLFEVFELEFYSVDWGLRADRPGGNLSHLLGRRTIYSRLNFLNRLRLAWKVSASRLKLCDKYDGRRNVTPIHLADRHEARRQPPEWGPLMRAV